MINALRESLRDIYIEASTISTGAEELRGLISDILMMTSPEDASEDVSWIYEHNAHQCALLAQQLNPENLRLQDHDATLLLSVYNQRNKPWSYKRIAIWYRYLRILNEHQCKIHPSNAWWRFLRLAANHNHAQWIDSSVASRKLIDCCITRSTAEHQNPHSHTVVSKVSRLSELLIPHTNAIYVETGDLPTTGNSLIAHLALHHYILTAAYADRHAARGDVTAPLYAAVNTALCKFVDDVAVWREYRVKKT